MSISPETKSWIPVHPESHFPIQNLPFGMACREDESETIVMRIGDLALDLGLLLEAGMLSDQEFPSLERLTDLDLTSIRQLRNRVGDLLRSDNRTLRDNSELREEVLVPVDDLDLMVPMDIPAFVDFYSGINHASNVGKMFRPDMPPLLPNYRHLPVGYNGRASSVIPSGVPVRRPSGQTKAADAESPRFGPTEELDFELELGFFIAEGNDLGEPISIHKTDDHILGMVLVNDWSARDVQRWEYQPLGPFLAKSFATSVSPWIVTLDALQPFLVAGEAQDPVVLSHLKSRKPGHYNLHLEVAIQTAAMSKPQVVTRTNSRHLYWTIAQQLAHQTSNGTNTEAGDLYASGTISGTEPGTFGSLLELTWRGRDKLTMEETGEERTFLEDGDTVIFTGYGLAEDYRIGFGELSATVFG